MVQDIIRDSTIGQAINYISNGRIFPYADQRPEFVVPPHFLLPSSQRPSTVVSPDSDATTLCGDLEKSGGTGVQLTRESTLAVDLDAEKQKQIDTALNSDPYIVGWYGDDDQENPRNWSPAKRAFVAFSISFLTFSVYIGSAIYTPSIPGLMADFNVSQTTATLGLSLYVLAYGIGPMFLAPLQELPGIGRNPVYMVTLFLFVVFQVPVAVARNMSTVLAFRFLTGFVGSPALATGGASMADIYPMHQFAYVLGIWATWRCSGSDHWSSHRRVRSTGERVEVASETRNLRSQGEKDKEGESLGAVMQEALIRPFILAKEPVLMFANVYLGFVYAIFYLWFEAFPLVFTDIYYFNLGLSGLPFLAFVVSGAITYTAYVFYLKYHIAPRYAKAAAAGIDIAPEIRLEIGLIASIFIPTSVLIFGFTSKESIHWMVPVIGAALYLPGIYLTFQSILTYITSAYPTYAASPIASVFPLFGRAFFVNLGLGPGSALLAGNLIPAYACVLVTVEMGTYLEEALPICSKPIEDCMTSFDCDFNQLSLLPLPAKRKGNIC
ncbi:major facilitator superfamily domain-containing protein [Armillaria novae-zelandiae]|uniref:Major facilitator superfamily domain-containing protein n=1 Tax=Armillaria novae-zelandiae TaxID=153914 RepID=A0AA39PU97_9AGAR|nr:major facilitator superfamily domain-containing protein [Armillaria novae-zelandiae]